MAYRAIKPLNADRDHRRSGDVGADMDVVRAFCFDPPASAPLSPPGASA